MKHENNNKNDHLREVKIKNCVQKQKQQNPRLRFIYRGSLSVSVPVSFVIYILNARLNIYFV